MKKFIQQHASKILGTLSGFDRMRFRGTLRLLAGVRGMMHFLTHVQVKLTQFRTFVQGVTDRLRDDIKKAAEADGCAVIHLQSSRADKEQLVRGIFDQQRRSTGLICVLSCVEPCMTFDIRGSRKEKTIDLVCSQRQCLHFYHYYFDAYFGLVHVRTQTWFPFNVHICINGREWLARQLDLAHISYLRRDNCFLDFQNLQRAQELMDNQLRTHWATHLRRLARQANPTIDQAFGSFPDPKPQYYWSLEESEWATDVMFLRPEDLQRLYPRFVHYAQQTFDSQSVMRFLGRKLHGNFQGEVVSRSQRRPEGICIKHKVNRNSIKMYDKFGSVLRVETTINHPRDMMVYRPKEGDSKGPKAWRYLRKGVADIHRRAHLCQAANNRYLDAVQKVDDTTSFGELLQQLCKPAWENGKRVRALNPFAGDDAKLLEIISRGEFLINGFRNRDLRVLFFTNDDTSDQLRRKQSSAISRKLRLLRAHKLIHKVQKTHRYQLTELGRVVVAAIAAARNATTRQLTSAA